MSDLHKYSCQSLNQDDIDAVVSVLQSEFLTQGPITEEFESHTASYVNAQYACAVNSATSGLHLALLALGIKPGDSIWTTPNTFVATVNAALYCGASVQLVDINLETLNIDIDLLETKLDHAQKSKTLPAAIIPVHFGGYPLDMERIDNLKKKYGFQVIEDVSHALGSSFNNEAIGSCKWSDATVFSFHPVKPVTCGEGGIITCNKLQTFELLKQLRSHGIRRQTASTTGKLAYEQISMGFNYRLSDIHAALGKSQLKRARDFVHTRAGIRELYEQKLQGFPISFQKLAQNSKSSHHLAVVRFANKSTRDRVQLRLQSEGIGTNQHYIPIYRHSFHKTLGELNDFPNMEAYFKTGLTLPLHAKLTHSEALHVCQIIKEELE